VCISGIQTIVIFNKSVELLVCADNIELIARCEAALKRSFMQFESAARMMGLRIKQSKTVYMPVSTRRTSNITYLEVGIYKFKCVEIFTYFGITVNTANNITEVIKTRRRSASRSYFGLQNHFKSCLLSRSTKIQLNKTLRRPIIT
jgi:hypothetical protein